MSTSAPERDSSATMGISAILVPTEYASAPALLQAAGGVAPNERTVLMHSDSTPNTTEETTEEVPYGCCRCGCGQKTEIARRTRIAFGWRSGEPKPYARGHHQRRINTVRAHPADPEKVLIQLTKGAVAVIDRDDLPLIRQNAWRLWQGPRGETYAASSTTNQLMHRVILGVRGDQCVDHINHDGLDNSRGNLRIATVSQNGANRILSKNNTSGFKGVSRHVGAWRAMIQKTYLGRFATAEAAARAYDDEARRIFGAYANLNFPSDEDDSEGRA